MVARPLEARPGFSATWALPIKYLSRFNTRFFLVFKHTVFAGTNENLLLFYDRAVGKDLPCISLFVFQ